MKYHFKIQYHTQWGEQLRMVGNIPQLGNDDLTRAVPMITQNGEHWELTVELNDMVLSDMTYSYLVFKEGQVVRQEFYLLKHQLPTSNKANIYIEDSWIDKPELAPLYTSAFTKVWNKRESIENKHHSVTNKNFELTLIEANIAPHETLAICGNTAELGSWNIENALMMDDSDFPKWKAKLNLDKQNLLEYKYVILNREDRSLISWELSDNRYYHSPTPSQNSYYSKLDAFAKFERTHWKACGVAVPVFSLRSERSWGIGEFLDIKQLVDWALLTNQKVVQILPINDTTSSNSWDDAYPYRCISVFALNPIYLNLDELDIADTPYGATYQKEKKQINQLTTIDFPYVQTKKQTYSHAIFKLKGKETFKSAKFKEFYAEQKHWLAPYAVYLVLRDKYETSDINCWDKYQNFRIEWIEEFDNPQHESYEKLQYTYFMQYHLYTQLKEVSDYANSKGVVLKGDLPIGIGLHSADAWTNPEFFHISCQAGAPPDDFATEGQNWGFPTYNWENIQKDDFSWWKNRLHYMSHFFQAYRIDHILGFFRIWSIPRSAIYGTLGQFSPALPLSVGEISSYGFNFNEELQTQPYISTESLDALSSEDKELVKSKLLTQIDTSRYHFKEEVNTQAKLRDYFLKNTDLGMGKEVLPLLMGLHTQVLFIEDMKQANFFHPRIEAFKTSTYQSLSAEDKLAFDRLYHSFYYERHNQFWMDEALLKLPQLIGASNMMVCGEDLGMIPQTVPEVMNALDILSLEVQRMPKAHNQIIGNPANNPYLSVSTFSTHDMSTMRGWWENDRVQARELYRELEGNKDSVPDKLNPPLAYSILNRELCGASMLRIEALQDWMALTPKWYDTISANEEQINIPANPKHRWKFRMAGYLEQLLEDKELSEVINQLTSNQ